jgi:adenylate cyclase
MLHFTITNKHERRQLDHPAGRIEFGRGPQRSAVPRCVVQDLYVSKDHVAILELDTGRVQVENLSQRNPIFLADKSAIGIGENRVLTTPVRLLVGETTLEIASSAEPVREGPLETVASPLRRGPGAGQETRLFDLGRSPTPEQLAHWFETVIAVQRAAAGSPEFYNQTARAMVALVGLDRGLVLLRRQDQWIVQARYPDEGAELRGREFSQTILERVRQEGRTFYQSQASVASMTESLQGVEAVVAAPIFGSGEEVVGAVYGCRYGFPSARNPGIGPLEAQVTQLLASVVGVGLARVEQEAETARLRVQFEQFFSATLAQELQKNPRLLDGQVREVTVLFSDIRSFSRLAERLGPTDTCRLVADVMERLTRWVREFDGVVVDYSGDGFMAMWNAPADQPDHAAKACRAALAMLAELPGLNAEWQERLQEPLRLGIGLNTGMALCGNTGSSFKFKYGALGHTVNLASRVEGATKQFGLPLLITGSTRQHLGDDFATRRLCRVRVVGVSGAVDLYELHAEIAPEEWAAKRDQYEAALALYEAGDWPGAYRELFPLLAHQNAPYDFSCLSLAGRVLDALKAPPPFFDGVIELEMK